jgi:hypothetical protein
LKIPLTTYLWFEKGIVLIWVNSFGNNNLHALHLVFQEEKNLNEQLEEKTKECTEYFNNYYNMIKKFEKTNDQNERLKQRVKLLGQS